MSSYVTDNDDVMIGQFIYVGPWPSTSAGDWAYVEGVGQDEARRYHFDVVLSDGRTSRVGATGPHQVVHRGVPEVFDTDHLTATKTSLMDKCAGLAAQVSRLSAIAKLTEA